MKQITGLLVPLLLTVIPAFAGEAVEQGAYWYRDGRPVALEPLSDGRRGGGRAAEERRYRSAHGGVVRRLSDRLYVCRPDGADAGWLTDLATRYAITPDGDGERVQRFQVAAGGDALATANAIFEREGVACAAPVWRKEMRRRSLNDPLLHQQWHLDNDGSAGGTIGADLNAFAAWDLTRGAGAVVAVADDGVEIDHPDLAPNVLVDHSRDHIDGDPDPTAGDHGTPVAGIIAAAGGNAEGGAGVAPEASLVGLRVMDELGSVDEAGVADAFGGNLYTVDIFNNSWGPPDDAINAFEGPSALERDAIDQAIRRGRGGLGQIFVWAGGNGGDSDNANLDGYANLRETIAVTASTDMGGAAYYAEEGANLLVNAPSSGGRRDIVTTDRSGVLGNNSGAESWEGSDTDYTFGFGGTSAATPAVSGVVALVLAANPGLNWREVQQLLAASAERNDPDHPRWRRNAAGYWINELHGFGRVDAGAAVALASDWGAPLEPEAETWQHLRTVSLSIPDDNSSGVSSSIFVTDRVRVEFVEVMVDIDHTYWGDLAIHLTSPAGTEVRLMTSRYLPPGARGLRFDRWTLGDTLHLGEAARGRWTLRVVDEEERDVGTLLSWGIRVYGTPLAESRDELPYACAGVALADGTTVGGATVHLGAARHGAALDAQVSGDAREEFGVLFGVTAGAVAEHLVVAEYTPSGGAARYFQYGAGTWSAWDGDPATLEGFADPDLDEGRAIAVHLGRLSAGRYRLYGGYREGGGAVVYCPDPLVVEVAAP